MAKIVVCEDEPDIRRLIETTFRRTDHALFLAADGAAGLALVERERPDLVLSDVAMPVMGGLALLDAVRARPEIAGTRFVFLTASAQKDQVSEGARRGADGYLTKPFSPPELRAAVERFLAGATADRVV